MLSALLNKTFLSLSLTNFVATVRSVCQVIEVTQLHSQPILWPTTNQNYVYWNQSFIGISRLLESVVYWNQSFIGISRTTFGSRSCFQFSTIRFLTCTFRTSCYSTHLSWAHTPVINWVVCLGQKVSSQ